MEIKSVFSIHWNTAAPYPKSRRGDKRRKRGSLRRLVRKSRFTHELINNSNEFTVAIPHEDMSEALALCGTKSGREMDKMEFLGLKTMPSKEINTPTLDCKGTHYECMVLYKTDMKPSELDELTKERWYGDNDFHTVYFAEIVNTTEK